MILNNGMLMNNYEYKIRTDLAIQNNSLQKKRTRKVKNIEIRNYQKEKYNYTNILYQHIENKENENQLVNIIVKELEKYLKKYNLNKKSSCLVIGLGNKRIVSDSLGPLTIEHIFATGYLKNLNIITKYRMVYTFIPDVLKNTGIMSYKSIKAIKKELKPDFIIIIDSLISGSIKYLNKVIQITDVGITPGSGISNYQEEISKNTLNIPVISIGIPSAIEASTIIKDALNIKEDKLLYKKGYDLIVSSKDIDIIMEKLSKILGESINKVLNNITFF